MSERSTRRSASISAATRAARLSLSPTLISSTATVSFSLMTGRTLEPEERHERVPGVQVPLPVAHVLLGEEHLGDPDAVRPAGLLVVPHERRLADRGRRLLLGNGPRLPAEPEPRGAGRDRARGHQRDLDAARHHRGQVGRQGLDARRIRPLDGIGDEPAPDLDHHAAKPAARHAWAPAARSTGAAARAAPRARAELRQPVRPSAPRGGTRGAGGAGPWPRRA